MTLEEHIKDIRSGISSERFSNEASVSQGIVQRLLQALGWPIYDEQVVFPQYRLEERRVNFALCHPPAKPIAFIEVKRIGQSDSDGAERQLFEDAFHTGVPLAILTDGREWNFFLPAEQGDYRARRIYKFDIVEREPHESASYLKRYLGYNEVREGRAIAAAREDYQNVSRTRQMLEKLPEAWTKLVSEEDDLLLELVADKVASLSGFKPDLETVSKFLQEDVALRVFASENIQVGKTTRTPVQRSVSQVSIPSPSVKAIPLDVNTKGIGFSLDGRYFPCKNYKTTLFSVINELTQRDQTFPERFAALPKHGTSRRYLARTPGEVHPKRSDFARNPQVCARLNSGWYVDLNVSKETVKKRVEMCCDVAAIEFGKDLIINLGE